MNKKLAGIFAMCALLLTGCQGAKESSKEITPPDTGWGKTVDEVLADWNLDRDQVEIFSETNSAAAIAVDTEATVFGEQTSRVMFQFINLDQTGATGKPVLCEVDITYPDDADMDTVKKEMEKSYGSSKGSITRYELYQSLGDDQLPEYTYKKADQPGEVPSRWYPKKRTTVPGNGNRLSRGSDHSMPGSGRCGFCPAGIFILYRLFVQSQFPVLRRRNFIF